MDQLVSSKDSVEYKKVKFSNYSNFSFRTYSELIKSKQTFLLVYTTLITYLISTWNIGIVVSDFFWITVGMFFAVSGSTLLNMYIDKDIDAIMERTMNRALPRGKVTPSTVLKYGVLFSIAGILIFGFFVNLLTMIIVFFGFFFDVIIYSILLKRRTKLSIIIGGIAGGLPALAGRTAAINEIDIIAILIGLFVLAWVPLHILTLALLPKNLEGYKNAKVPMWPVVSSKNSTILVITLSAIVTASVIVIIGFLLEINIIILLPLIIFSIFILYQSFSNLKKPSSDKLFKIFKFASIFMVFGFIWLFIGVVITSSVL